MCAECESYGGWSFKSLDLTLQFRACSMIPSFAW